MVAIITDAFKRQILDNIYENVVDPVGFTVDATALPVASLPC